MTSHACQTARSGFHTLFFASHLFMFVARPSRNDVLLLLCVFKEREAKLEYGRWRERCRSSKRRGFDHLLTSFGGHGVDSLIDVVRASKGSQLSDWLWRRHLTRVPTPRSGSTFVIVCVISCRVEDHPRPWPDLERRGTYIAQCCHHNTFTPYGGLALETINSSPLLLLFIHARNRQRLLGSLKKRKNDTLKAAGQSSRANVTRHAHLHYKITIISILRL